MNYLTSAASDFIVRL